MKNLSKIPKKNQKFKNQLNKKNNEIYIGYLNDKTPVSKSFEKDPRFSKELSSSLTKKIKELGDLKKNTYAQTTNIQFEEGGQICFLFLVKSITNHHLQTVLRKSVATLLHNTDGVVVNTKKLSKPHQLQAIQSINVLNILETWQMTVYGQKSKEQKEKKPSEINFQSSLTSTQLKNVLSKSKILSEKNNLVRTLACLPANILNPHEYKKIIHERAKKNHYKYDFISADELKKIKAGGITAVLSADPNSEGGIVHLTYKPKSKSKKILSLVGKGLCFDTGGYNVKTGGYMYTMHRDMTGSAVALALFETLVHLKAPYEVHAYLAIAENLISPTGYKPNEVVIALDGTSIEVVDTDAEGRMVLCDTLVYSKKCNPDLILDFATLTGGAVYSIGTKRSAIFSNQEQLGKLAVQAGEESGERCWLFPIGEDYFDNIKSDVADILQCSSARGVDHINAASFLSHFVGDTPWVHMDLSSEENKGGLGLVGSDVTGFGVMWGLKLIERYFKKEL